MTVPAAAAVPFLKTAGGAAAIEAAGGLASGLVGLLAPDPTKKAFKYWGRAKKDNLKDVQNYLKPRSPWQNISGNMQPMNAALAEMIAKKIGMYGGVGMGAINQPQRPQPQEAATGGEFNPRYPWMKGMAGVG